MGSCGGEEAEEGGFNSVQIVHGPYKVLPSRNTMWLEKLEETRAKD